VKQKNANPVDHIIRTENTKKVVLRLSVVAKEVLVVTSVEKIEAAEVVVEENAITMITKQLKKNAQLVFAKQKKQLMK
jgi:hypothetical protein